MIPRLVSAVLSLAAVSAVAAGTALAQTGVLTGVVLDQNNRDGLNGVIVRVVGTDLMDGTDMNGRFTIPGVPVGDREIEAKHPEYAPFKLSRIRIAAGDTARVTFAMTVQVPTAIDAPWAMSATEFRGRNGQRFTFRCAPGGSAGAVWGTDVYTDDSSVCTAAVHAGRITFAEGGVVTFEISAGMAAYTPSARNGVSSGSYETWEGSFIIR